MLTQHRLWGVGWGTYSFPRVQPYMAFWGSTCSFSDRPLSRSHWHFLCLPRYHWPAVHCKTIQESFALVPGSLHTFRSWFCRPFYEAFCFYPEAARWNHIKIITQNYGITRTEILLQRRSSHWLDFGNFPPQYSLGCINAIMQICVMSKM